MVEQELEKAISLDEYNEFPDEAHAARLQWRTTNDNDYKPALVKGRRIVPGSYATENERDNR